MTGRARIGTVVLILMVTWCLAGGLAIARVAFGG